ncbi:hypothetical protein [Kitasatospora camelliae]|uniref:Uncharacterized protein n=1 Tax=Kitasatospora camelliae TaxID=3156397 RepID=A0AAU8JQQ1_9ACTN
MTIRGLLDRALLAAARRAGEPEGLRFTERQLYYELCRVLQPLHRGPRRLPYTLAPPVRYRDFRAALAGRPEIGVLPPPASRPAAALPPAESDLYDYAFPRLLVCQDRSIAAMIRANGIHLEAACPVFAAADLPLDARLTEALDRAGGAVVHVLHDASPAGLACYRRIRDRYSPLLRVRPMGLAPRDAAALHLTAGRSPTPYRGPLPPGMRAGERAWLAAGRFSEVAAVPPARLLRTVIRGVRGEGVPARLPVRHRLRGLRGSGFLTWPSP